VALIAEDGLQHAEAEDDDLAANEALVVPLHLVLDAQRRGRRPIPSRDASCGRRGKGGRVGGGTRRRQRMRVSGVFLLSGHCTAVLVPTHVSG